MRTGAAVGAGFRVLGEGDLDADKPAHIIGLTYARPEPEKEGKATEAAKIPRVHKKAPDDAGALRCQDLSVLRHGASNADQSRTLPPSCNCLCRILVCLPSSSEVSFEQRLFI